MVRATDSALDAYAPLSSTLFRGTTVQVAKRLIGCVLVHEGAEGLTAGRIVETESYEQGDPASHSFRGPTERNRVMFERDGLAYVYRIYGVHWCVNVSCGSPGFGAAVLLRALEPIAGLDIMATRRQMPLSPVSLRRLCAGPGRLTQAMGIHRGHNSLCMRTSPLRILQPHKRQRLPIVATPRIGISKAVDRTWRFILADCPYVSGTKAQNRPV